MIPDSAIVPFVNELIFLLVLEMHQIVKQDSDTFVVQESSTPTLLFSEPKENRKHLS